MRDPATIPGFRGFAALAALIFSACGSSAGGPVTLTGVMLPGCGPADGPAVELYLSDDSLAGIPAPDTLAMLRPVDSIGSGGGPLVASVMIWRDATRLSGRTWTFDDGGRTGSASLCRLDAGCEMVAGGSVTVDAVDETSVSGSLELATAGGQRMAGRFLATRESRSLLCG